MKFGIFYEHQLPRPWDGRSEADLLRDALEQVELADSLGFEYLWEVEHHFLEEYSHSSAPELFLAACSQRTRNIRLGHGICLTAPAFNHPARVAERIATLDLLSGGRVEFGSGESSSEAELGGFGIPYERKRDAWLEGLEVSLRCLTETPFGGHEGEFVSMPARNVVPKPLQSPHPPLWVACSRHETIKLAAQKGIGALTFAFIDPEDARGWVDDYRRIMAEECVPVGRAVNPNLACVTPMMCHPDESVAMRMGLEGGNFFGYSLAHYYLFGEHQPGVTDVWQEFQEKRTEHGYDPDAALAQHGALAAKTAAGDRQGLRGAVGTPDQIREFCRRYEEVGVDQLIFVMQAGRNRHEDIMESLHRFGTEILPEFKERDSANAPALAASWEPIIEAALARRGPDPEPAADDYRIKAIPRQLVDAGLGDTFGVTQQMLDDAARSQALGESRDQGGILG